MTTDKERADKERADMNRTPTDKERHDKERHDNAAQDPNHPMNKTPAARDPRAPHDGTIEGPVYSSDNLRTEQEKDTSSDVPGVGPALPPEVEPEPVETIQEQGIGPRTPYPTGNPPPVHEEVTRSQGINKGRDDHPVAKPDKPAPAGQPTTKETHR